VSGVVGMPTAPVGRISQRLMELRDAPHSFFNKQTTTKRKSKQKKERERERESKREKISNLYN